LGTSLEKYKKCKIHLLVGVYLEILELKQLFKRPQCDINYQAIHWFVHFF